MDFTSRRTATASGNYDGAGSQALFWGTRFAYITWRIEQLAIVELHSLSDHELNDLGLPRSEIAGAVKAWRQASMGSAPSAQQPSRNA